MSSELSETRGQQSAVEVSIVVPARNEEKCISRCLFSLVTQAGVPFEIIVVDDHSTDRTRRFAESFLGVKVVAAESLRQGWIGKNNACWTGARHARGTWLLFTDADTVHAPASLATALAEAKQHGSSLLSYSPAQQVRGFWERAVMPLVFAELALHFRLKDVCDPACDAAAANGQYLLISREAYNAIGGHAAVGGEILEDVALARLVKRSGRRIRFRYGGGLVRTRMYRGLRELVAGWSKNLALLFPDASQIAGRRIAEFAVIVLSVAIAAVAFAKNWRAGTYIAAVFAALTWMKVVWRTRVAHFDALSTLVSPLGLPVFAYLLRRSQLLHRKGTVRWKGRQYSGVPATTKS